MVELGKDSGEGNDLGIFVELGLHSQRHGGEVGSTVDNRDLALDAEGDSKEIVIVPLIGMWPLFYNIHFI